VSWLRCVETRSSGECRVVCRIQRSDGSGSQGRVRSETRRRARRQGAQRRHEAEIERAEARARRAACEITSTVHSWQQGEMKGAECRPVSRKAAERIARVTDTRQRRGQRRRGTALKNTPKERTRTRGWPGRAWREGRTAAQNQSTTRPRAGQRASAEPDKEKTTRNNTRTEPKETAASAPAPLMNSAFTAATS